MSYLASLDSTTCMACCTLVGLLDYSPYGKAGALTPNAKGILPNGDFGDIIKVAGMEVRLIGGRIINGQVVISSISRKGL